MQELVAMMRQQQNTEQRKLDQVVFKGGENAEGTLIRADSPAENTDCAAVNIDSAAVNQPPRLTALTLHVSSPQPASANGYRL